MDVYINVDDIRMIAGYANEAAEKMNEANGIINTVVSQHNWKCTERMKVDESLETIKSNSNSINEAFSGFSLGLIAVANEFTDYLNYGYRTDTVYADEISTLLSRYSSGKSLNLVNSGSNFNNLFSSLESSSMDTSNIASLHGSTHGINIVDFSLFKQ